MKNEEENKMYAAPSEYVYDPETQLYYEYTTYQDELGQEGYIVNWFNPETGEFIQKTYPKEGPKKKKSGTGKIIFALILGIALMIAAFLYVNMDDSNEETESSQESSQESSDSNEEEVQVEVDDSSESDSEDIEKSSQVDSSVSGTSNAISLEVIASQVDLQFAQIGDEYNETIYGYLMNAILDDYYLDVEYTFNEAGMYEMTFTTEEKSGTEVGYYELDGNVLTVESEVYGSITYVLYLYQDTTNIMYAIVYPEMEYNEFWIWEPYGEGSPEASAEIGVTYN